MANVNERVIIVKRLISFLKKIKTRLEHTPNAETKIAINDAKAGKLNSYKSSNELFKTIRSKENYSTSF